METEMFEAYVLELLAVLERLPFPIALSAPGGERIGENQAFRNRDGSEPLLLALTDTAHGTALAESERRYRLITEAMPQFVWLDAADGAALYANQRWLEYTGLTPEENQGYGWERVAHPEDLKRLESDRVRTLQSGEPYEGECRYRGKDGKYRWFLFRSIPVRDESGSITSWLGTATDIDSQKRAKDQQAFFALASDLLASTLDVENTLQRIARLAIASLGTWCQIDLPDAHGHLRVAVTAHQDPAKEVHLNALLGERLYDAGTPLGPPAVMRTCKPQLLKQVEDDAVRVVIPSEKHREIYRRVGYVAGVMVPLRSRDRVLGVLGIASDDPTRLYTEFDVATALELGRRGASALENASSFEREHRVATTLQSALLPASLPSGDGVQFFSAYSAAAAAEGEAVGGDWYDAFPLDAVRIAVSIGDVAGHGMDAAVTMGTVRQAFRAAALAGRAPKEVLIDANRIAQLERRAAMITAVFGIYDTRTRDFTYSIAGHPSPLLVDAQGTLSALDSAGPPLGDAFDAAHITQRTLAIPPEAALVFYTDGLLEFDHHILKAAEQLENAVRRRSFLAADHPAQAIIDAVLDAPQRDDIAVLVMQTGV